MQLWQAFIFIFLIQGAYEGEQVVGPFHHITVSSTNRLTSFVCSIFRINVTVLCVFRVNKAMSLKRQSSTADASTSSDGGNHLQGAPALTERSAGPDEIFAEADQQPQLKMEACSSSAENGDRLSVNAPAHSLLDILAEQALAHEYSATLSQELFAAAVGKHWNLSEDRSPAPPPPPLQSSPVDFPETNICPVALPHLLQVRAMSRGCWPGVEER